MRKGIDLIDLFGKIMLGAMFVLFVLSFVVGPILLFVGFGFFFIFPVLESVSTFYHKWLYRNIVLGIGFLDEEAGMWEKVKWRIIKVVDFKKLPKILHQLYLKNIKENYTELIRDKDLDKINKKFLITTDGDAIPIEPIPIKPSLENSIGKKKIEFKDEEEEEEDIEENQIEEEEELDDFEKEFKETYLEETTIKVENQSEFLEINGEIYPYKFISKYKSLGKVPIRSGKYTKSFKEWCYQEKKTIKTENQGEIQNE